TNDRVTVVLRYIGTFPGALFRRAEYRFAIAARRRIGELRTRAGPEAAELAARDRVACHRDFCVEDYELRTLRAVCEFVAEGEAGLADRRYVLEALVRSRVVGIKLQRF